MVVDRRFRGREVVDPYLKDTMIDRSGQPGLPGQRGFQSGFSLAFLPVLTEYGRHSGANRQHDLHDSDAGMRSTALRRKNDREFVRRVDTDHCSEPCQRT